MSTWCSHRRPTRAIRREHAGVLVGVALASACATQPGTLRFHDRAPVWQVDDAQPIAKPHEAGAWKNEYYFEYDFQRTIDFALSVPDRSEARNLNSLGEVPDSSWFTNRIGVREVTVDEIRHGGDDTATPTPPFRVRKAYTSASVLVDDANGVVFVLKLDSPDLPELASTSDVVSQRLLWAIGYNTAHDEIVHVERDQLVVAPDATRKLGRKQKVQFSEASLDEMLRGQPRDGLGRYRVLASEFLPGEPVGPFTTEGTRREDANDRVPHEHRRELRGQYVFFGWLAHTDLHPGNRLDMWIEHAPGSGTGHLVHYLIDFDQSLGAFALDRNSNWDSYAHRVDYAYFVPSVLALGLWKRPWEGLAPPGLRGVGRFDAEHFRPSGYHPRDYYMPFLHKTDLDCFWAAKLLVRLERRHIQAAVDSAQLSDPRSAAYLVDTLIARQRASARHWFRRVTPLDGFTLTDSDAGQRLCATDLLLAHGLADREHDTRYLVRSYDGDGDRRGRRRTVLPDAQGRVCVADLRPSASTEGYLIVELRAHRDDGMSPPLFVHLARDPATAALRVIGLDRRA